jgi:hypothetical protein
VTIWFGLGERVMCSCRLSRGIGARSAHVCAAAKGAEIAQVTWTVMETRILGCN